MLKNKHEGYTENFIKYLSSHGFEVKKEVIFGTKRADLIATKGKNRLFLEIKDYPKRAILTFDSIAQASNFLREAQRRRENYNNHSVIVGTFNVPEHVSSTSSAIGVDLAPVKNFSEKEVRKGLDCVINKIGV